MSTPTLRGIIIWARHGDRQGFYQDPVSYTATHTAITPLGEVQEQQLGAYLATTYLDSNSDLWINPISSFFNDSQVQVRADGGDEGGVIFDSSVALLQGLFSPTNKSIIQLANGTNITSPLGGYQYIPIESVQPNEDVSLEGFTSCNTQADRTTAIYNSTAFKEVAQANTAFLNSLPPYLDGRSATLENMFNIWDYMEVNSVHNKTFILDLPAGYLAEARTLANYHEYTVFSDSNFTGIGNIAARTVLPSLMTAMQRIVNQSDPLLLHYTAMSYKPFLSFFNMTGVVETNQIPGGVVNYAAAMVLELWQNGTDEPTIRFKFKNGTDDDVLRTYNMSFSGFGGGGDAPLSAFLDAFQPAAVNSTLQWCNVCGQTTARGCGQLLAAASSTPAPAHHDKISPVGAGFLGAGLTFAVMSMLLAALALLGLLSFGRKAGKTSSHRGLTSEDGSAHNEKAPAAH